VEAFVAAYNEAEPWLDQILSYLEANKQFLESFIQNHLPQLEVIQADATFLIWIDFRKLGIGSNDLFNQLLSQARIKLNPGTQYGIQGDGFMRWNIACPRSLLEEGLSRLAKFVHSLTD
jgi:cystathionine beta-lyase